jgi:hypothetical protein
LQKSLSKDTALGKKPHLHPREYDQIVQLGLPAVPYIIKKMETAPQAFALDQALAEITKVKFDLMPIEKEKEEVRTGSPSWKSMQDAWISWWKEGRKQTPRRFEALYSEWKKFEKAGKEGEAVGREQKIRELGIVALPCIVQKIEQGDDNLLPAFLYLTDKEVGTTATVSEALSWWAANKEKWTLPDVDISTTPSTHRPANQLPTPRRRRPS